MVVGQILLDFISNPSVFIPLAIILSLVVYIYKDKLIPLLLIFGSVISVIFITKRGGFSKDPSGRDEFDSANKNTNDKFDKKNADIINKFDNMSVDDVLNDVGRRSRNR